MNEEKISRIGATPDDPQSLSSVISELGESLANVVKSEAHLLRAEFRETTTVIKKHGMQLAAYGALTVLGALPLVAFLVIGLGQIINDNYWLSSLIVGFALVGGGAFGVNRVTERMEQEDLSFPLVRESLQTQKNIINQKAHEVSDAATRRAS